MWSSISLYFQSLAGYLHEEWQQMTPDKYGTLLIIVAVVGYLMMKNSGR